MSQTLASAAARSARAGQATRGHSAGERLAPRPGPRPGRAPERSPLRVVHAPATAGSPLGFALACMALLGAGLIALLLLNTAVAQGSFTVQSLQAQNQSLSAQEQDLAQGNAMAASPQQLAARAWALGLVPAESSAFLKLPSGKVVGVADPAPRATPPTVVTSITNPTGTTDPTVPNSTSTTTGTSQGSVPGTTAGGGPGKVVKGLTPAGSGPPPPPTARTTDTTTGQQGTGTAKSGTNSTNSTTGTTSKTDKKSKPGTTTTR